MIREASGRDWRGKAACARPGIDPEWYFPIDTGEAGTAAVTRAKRVCAGCAVRVACLADVMAAEDPAERWGVAGGLSADERAELFARDRAPAAVPVLVVVGPPGVQLGLFDLDPDRDSDSAALRAEVA